MLNMIHEGNVNIFGWFDIFCWPDVDNNSRVTNDGERGTGRGIADGERGEKFVPRGNPSN